MPPQSPPEIVVDIVAPALTIWCPPRDGNRSQVSAGSRSIISQVSDRVSLLRAARPEGLALRRKTAKGYAV